MTQMLQKVVDEVLQELKDDKCDVAAAFVKVHTEACLLMRVYSTHE